MERKLSIKFDLDDTDGRLSLRVSGIVTDEIYTDANGSKYNTVRLTENYVEEILYSGGSKRIENPFEIMPDKETGECLMYITPNTTTDAKNIMYFLQNDEDEPMFISLDEAIKAMDKIEMHRDLIKITNTAGNSYGEAIASASETLSALVGDIANANTEVKMTKAKLVAEVFNHKYMQCILAEI